MQGKPSLGCEETQGKELLVKAEEVANREVVVVDLMGARALVVAVVVVVPVVAIE